MQLNQAVAKRIKQLCCDRKMTQYQLSMSCGVPQSTLSTIMNCTFKSMKLRIIYKICEGLEITIYEFFNSPLFDRENIQD